MLNETIMPSAEKVKYLGIYVNCKTNCVDPSAALRKLFGTFNNIMSVLGHGRDEILAVHLFKTYCLPVLLYGCEIWHISPSDTHNVNVSWNNCFRKIFNACFYITAIPCLHLY